MDSTLDNGANDANQEASPQVVQHNSFDPDRFEERLLNKVKELISDPRTTQSLKDKTVAEIKKDKGFKDFLNEYKTMREAGMTDREIELEARLKELELSRYSTPDNHGKVVDVGQIESARLFAKALNLDLNDPEVIPLLSINDVEEATRGLVAISNRRQRNVSPAVAAQPTGGGAKTTDLLSEYEARASSVRGQALIALKMEYRKKGLDIS